MKEKRFRFKDSQGIMENVRTITDTETGVQYLFVKSGYAGGLSPLLDRDGKPLLDNSCNEE